MTFYLQAAEHLQSFIADCDRRTEMAKKRLAETQDEISAEVAAKVMEWHLTVVLFVQYLLLWCYYSTLIPWRVHKKTIQHIE